MEATQVVGVFDIRESRRVHRVFGVSSKDCPGDIYNISTDRADIAPAFALCDDGLMMRWTQMGTHCHQGGAVSREMRRIWRGICHRPVPIIPAKRLPERLARCV